MMFIMCLLTKSLRVIGVCSVLVNLTMYTNTKLTKNHLLVAKSMLNQILKAKSIIQGTLMRCNESTT